MDKRLVLALDTSHPYGSVAVTRGEDILCEITFDASDTHSATLMPAVDYCLKSSKCIINDIDVIAVVIGPGSFTGLRIGLATAKAFASATHAVLVPVVSLEVLAASFPYHERAILPLIDARRGEVYGGLYYVSSSLPEEILKPFSLKPEEVVERVLSVTDNRGILACGTGAYKYHDIFGDLFGSKLLFAPKRWSLPSASLLARLALFKEPISREEVASIEPLYIRPPDAKIPSRKLKEI